MILGIILENKFSRIFHFRDVCTPISGVFMLFGPNIGFFFFFCFSLRGFAFKNMAKTHKKNEFSNFCINYLKTNKQNKLFKSRKKKPKRANNPQNTFFGFNFFFFSLSHELCVELLKFFGTPRANHNKNYGLFI